jgi:hypothetical protein
VAVMVAVSCAVPAATSMENPALVMPFAIETEAAGRSHLLSASSRDPASDSPE